MLKTARHAVAFFGSLLLLIITLQVVQRSPYWIQLRSHLESL